MPQVDLESIETQCREGRTIVGMERVRTHWEGCWVSHPQCAIPIVEQLTAALREATKRQVTLDRIVVDHILRQRPTIPEWRAAIDILKTGDDDKKAEIMRIAKAWGIEL